MKGARPVREDAEGGEREGVGWVAMIKKGVVVVLGVVDAQPTGKESQYHLGLYVF